MASSVERRRAVALYSKMFKIEYHVVIKFLTKEGKSPAEIKQCLDSVYRETSPSYSTVKEWAKQFRLWTESTEDNPRQGRPTEELTPETTALVQEEVLQDRRLKTKEISARCGLSKTMVLRILHDHLGMNKVSARWVPKLFSVVQKQLRVECCTEFLAICEGHEKEVIESIVMEDGTTVLYHDLLSKRESMEWRYPGSPQPKKKQRQHNPKKDHGLHFLGLSGNSAS
jgi:histone-lysine N-methyltransferase SETMAR